MKAILEFWSPENKSMVTESGFRYLSTKSVFKLTEEVEYSDDTDLFIQFYKLNNRLRYCNGSYYKLQDKQIESRYMSWLSSNEFKKISFDLYYGNGVVD